MMGRRVHKNDLVVIVCLVPKVRILHLKVPDDLSKLVNLIFKAIIPPLQYPDPRLKLGDQDLQLA